MHLRVFRYRAQNTATRYGVAHAAMRDLECIKALSEAQIVQLIVNTFTVLTFQCLFILKTILFITLLSFPIVNYLLFYVLVFSCLELS
jgi:ABC-type bacteriocin/lantibiotic exporter with double-glycine peptidase domain